MRGKFVHERLRGKFVREQIGGKFVREQIGGKFVHERMRGKFVHEQNGTSSDPEADMRAITNFKLPCQSPVSPRGKNFELASSCK